MPGKNKIKNINKAAKEISKDTKRLNKATKRIARIKIPRSLPYKSRFADVRGLGATDSRWHDEPTRAVDFRKFNVKNGEFEREMDAYARMTKARYLIGLIHPDIAVKEQIPVKMYSDVPIPTASVGWHEQYNFSTSLNGTFLLSFLPSYFCDQDFLSSNTGGPYTGWSRLTYNSAAGLTGNAVVAGNAFVASSYTPNIATQRYRLVSCLIKVSYNGNVLNQSGTLVSCAVFDPMTPAIGTAASPVTGYSNANIDRYGVFSLISNGLWNETVNITKDSEGLEALFVPIDPDDFTFDRTGTFKGSSKSAAGTFVLGSEGAPISYVVAGKNLPVSTNCIIVDVYTNYEVIADATAAPFLRSAPDTVYSSKDHSDIVDTVKKSIVDGGMIKQSRQKETHTFGHYLRTALKAGVKYIPQVLEALAS
jgi:hypothetical protein